LSFWVKCTKTGSFALSLRDTDNNRRDNRLVAINSANTWEKKTLSYDGDTTGVLNNDNATSLMVQLWLDSGSNYNSGTQQSGWVNQNSADINAGNTLTLADSTANDFYITGVQLEAGQTASEFEFLPVDVNLARCQRYFQKSYNQGVAPQTVTNTSREIFEANGSVLSTVPKFVTEMRASPTISVFSPADGTSGIDISGTNSIGATVADAGTNSFRVSKGGTPGFLSFHYTASGEL